jgi:hypothetical protein
MLEGVFVHEAIKVLGQGTGDFRGSTGAGAIHQPLDPLVCEAMDPLAQGGIGKVQRVGHRLEALAFDNLAHSLGTTEDPGFFRLLEIGIQGGEGLIRKVEFESPHRGVSRKKLLQKFTRAHCLLILLSEQNLSDSNFSGAAINASNSGAESWTGIGVVAGFGAVVLMVQSPHGSNGEVHRRSELLQIL